MHVARQPHRTLLISGPFVGLDRPSLGLSLLKAQLGRGGLPCDVRYLTFPMAEAMGRENYDWITDEIPYNAFVGDWLFAESLYGRRAQADRQYLNGILRGKWGLPNDALNHILRLRTLVEPFLEQCLETIDWNRYSVVGFTSTFSQNVPALSLARRVKRRNPAVRIVFGGANWEGAMGRMLHRRFRFVDFALSGEADVSFPMLIENVAARQPSLDRVPGLSYRASGTTRNTAPVPPLLDLDGLPVPDFDDFFHAWEASAATEGPVPHLLIETSRGCWWGAKSHCTFCGLNGNGMAFRSKSAERVLQELRQLSERYGVRSFEVVDNILDMAYFRTLLPALAAEGGPYKFFYETKANLTAAQVALLRQSGVVRIQPGIESMSDSILARMRKGTTALRNVQLLKWCREFGVHADWNVLYGFPGEDVEAYAAMRKLLERIRFLTPPSGFGPVRLDRFSPYHEDPAAHGIRAVRPMAVYRHLYPFPVSDLAEIAYYFDYDHADGRSPEAYAAPLVAFLRDWEQQGHRGDLTMQPVAGGFLLIDHRPGRPRRTRRLDGWQARVYAFCDRARGREAVLATARDAGSADHEARRFLRDCVAEGLMLESSGYYLSLAVHRPARKHLALSGTQELAVAGR